MRGAPVTNDDSSEGTNRISPFNSLLTPPLKVDFQGSRVTSDGGLILVREFARR